MDLPSDAAASRTAYEQALQANDATMQQVPNLERAEKAERGDRRGNRHPASRRNNRDGRDERNDGQITASTADTGSDIANNSVPSNAPVAATPAPVLAAVAAPTPAPMPIAKAERMAETEVAAVAQNAGLAWVQTDSDAFAKAQGELIQAPAAPKAARQRPPRVVVEAAPMEMVQTKPDAA